MDCIIDFHAHILPGADHGSSTLETSIKQLELLRSVGVDTVVATPHFYPTSDKVEKFLARRSKSAEKLLSSDTARKTGPRVILGAEVLVCEHMEKMTGLEKLTIPGTDCILLEMPTTEWTVELIETVERISEKFTVILAHIDRYPFEEVSQLLSLDSLLAQLNPHRLCSFFGKRKFYSLIDSGKVIALGSDLHGSHGTQVKDFEKALKKMGSVRADMIMRSTSSLLHNAEYLF